MLLSLYLVLKNYQISFRFNRIWLGLLFLFQFTRSHSRIRKFQAKKVCTRRINLEHVVFHQYLNKHDTSIHTSNFQSHRFFGLFFIIFFSSNAMFHFTNDELDVLFKFGFYFSFFFLFFFLLFCLSSGCLRCQMGIFILFLFVSLCFHLLAANLMCGICFVLFCLIYSKCFRINLTVKSSSNHGVVGIAISP